MQDMRKVLRRENRSRGAALVEFAVVAPLLLTIVFGIIEYGYIFMVRQTVQNAAREGCRIAVLQTTDEPYSNVTARVNQAMEPTKLTNYTISMTHATPTNPVESVEVSVPTSDVSLVGNFFSHSGDYIRGTCSMRKEGVGNPPSE